MAQQLQNSFWIDLAHAVTQVRKPGSGFPFVLNLTLICSYILNHSVYTFKSQNCAPLITVLLVNCTEGSPVLKGLPITQMSAALCKVGVKQNVMCKLLDEIQTPIYRQKGSCLSGDGHYQHPSNVDTSVSFKMCQISLQNLDSFLAYGMCKLIQNAGTWKAEQADLRCQYLPLEIMLSDWKEWVMGV